ncbi:MAG: hypothetical protein EAZ19_00415 [Oscillatoriales cyanobacterium]|jgi:hypothetical protein|nr:MAG: hypothetical protein EAZ88_08775 [Oscillatoriales cyanobacterium]TAG99423.1 MAG: hypothetical protein EAZ19_00415 [Oscillatoriales cyanobacterium]
MFVFAWGHPPYFGYGSLELSRRAQHKYLYSAWWDEERRAECVPFLKRMGLLTTEMLPELMELFLKK